MLTRTRTALLITAALLALAGCGGRSANPHPKVLNAYVAMGDSYTALAGVGPYTDRACRRTADNYPNLVAKDVDVKNLVDASCGGATSQDVTQTQVLMNRTGSRPPQLDALSKDTKLVTLGIGLNDYQLAYYLLYVCVPINGVTLPTCSQYLKQPDSALVEEIRMIGGLVKTNLKDIRTAAPNARIVLVGYPRVLADGADCAADLPMPGAAASRLRSSLKLVNQQLAATATSAKVDYVDMYAASKGHELCSSDPWIAGDANIPGTALSFHPYKAYHRAVADEIVALLRDR